MKKNKFENIEHMAHLLSLPADAVLGSSRVELLSDKQALVINHEGLIEYSDVQICINSKGRIIKISGSELCVAAMNQNALKLTGKIKSLEFV